MPDTTPKMPDTTPTWGSFVSHYDSAGQVPTMDVIFNVPKTTVSLAFERMEVMLLGNNKDQLTGSIGLAGFFPIALPDNFEIRGYVLSVTGKVFKSFDTSAILTLSIGEDARVFEWPRTMKVIHSPAGETTPGTVVDELNFRAECFTSEDHSSPVLPVPPLTFAIGMHARRSSTEGTIQINLDNVEISMVKFVTP